MPLVEVDARPIPDVEDFTPLLGSLPQCLDGLAFESTDVVFLFSRGLVVDGEMAQGAATQVACVEMADGRFVALAVGRIMRGMSMIVAVASVDVEASETRKGGD